MKGQQRLSTAARTAAASLFKSLRILLPALAAVLLWQSEARATHAMGGELTYECIGTNIYRVHLNFYRDCNGVAAPTNCSNGRQFRVRSAQCNVTLNPCFSFDGVDLVTPICVSATDRCNSSSGVYGIERYRYSAVVNLSSYGACGTDWIIDWDLCCRNNAITSLNDPGNRNLYLYARLNSTLAQCNNSPTYLNTPTPFSCVGGTVSYNHGFNDVDGDSLAFALVNALGANGTNIPYNAGYSATQPVITSGGANAVQINPVTGTITFVPSIQQFAVVTVRVREYRNGVQIGEYIRDVQFAIIACSNNLPQVSGVNGTNQYTYAVCANESFCFTVNSSDADAGQVVTMTWNNGIPGATFTTTPGSLPVGTFCWTPTTANIGQNLFAVNVQDNACVLNGVNNFGFAVQVTPPFTPAQAGPDQNVCGSSATLAGQLPWSGVPGTWTVINGAGTFANANSPTSTVSGLGLGANTFRWTVNYGTCGSTSDDVVITSYNPAQAAANAGPDQSICLPSTSVTLAGNSAPSPAVGTWSLVSGTGAFANVNSPTTAVTGLSQGANTFRWTINNGPCGAPTNDQVTVFVFSNLQGAANAGNDQQLCAPATSTTLTGNTLIFPASGLWTVVAGAGTFGSATSPTTTVSGLGAGLNTFRWTITNGPCVPPSTQDDVNVTVFNPASPNANAGPDQQVCSANTTLAGNTPIAPATGTWTVVSGTGAFGNANSPTSTVSGLSIGSNTFQWTLNNGPCANGITTDQVTIVRFDPATPAAAAGPDQDLCTVGGTGLASTTLAATAATAPATGAWSIISGPAGAIITTPTNPATTVTNLAVGTYILRWTVSNGPCVPPATIDDITIRVFDRNAAAANAGPDQNLCAPVASVTLAGNAATAPASGTWSVINGNGIFANASSPTTTVTGMSIGVNTYRWTLNNGPCPGAITSDDAVITLFDPATAAANAGADQSLCGATNAVMSANAVALPAVGTWTVISGTATIGNPNSATSAITGLTAGTVVLQWTVNNGPCGSSNDQVSIFNYNPNDPVANAGPDQDICVPVAPNVVFMNASTFTPPSVGTWTTVSGPGGQVIANVNSPTTQISNLTVGTYVFRWTVDNGPCVNGITFDEVTIRVFDFSNPLANAGPDQSLCTTNGSTVMAGSAVTNPATGSWALVTGTGTITNPTSPTTTVTGLQVGQNIFQWNVDNGPCTGITTDQMSIFVYDPNNPAANAGLDQAFCTPVTSTAMTGSAVIFPATGVWVQSGGPAATITNPNDPLTTITNIQVGVSQFTWTVTNGVCANPVTSDQMTITLADGDAQAADAGPDQQVCGTSTTVTLGANTPTGVATGSWSVVQGTANFANTASATTTVTGLSIGVNILRWSINNGACGITSDVVSIFVYDPNNPVANAGPDQQLCTPTTSGTLTGSSLIVPAVGTWTLISGSGTIASPNAPTTGVSGLSVGANVFQWQVNNGACPNAITTDLVVITVFDNTAAIANAGPDIDICTPTSSVSMAANSASAPALGTWTLTGGAGGTITNVNNPNTTITGLPVGTHTYAWTISNGPCGTTSDEVTIRVFNALNPIANAGNDQQLCWPASTSTLQGSNVISPAVGTWTLVSGTGAPTNPNAPNSFVTGLSIGENVFQWTVSNGPCANPLTTDLVSIFVFDNAQADADAGPDQEICTPQSSVTLAGNTPTFPADGFWFQVQGLGTITNPADPNTTVTGLPVGEHIFQWEINNGPCGSSNDQVTIRVFDVNNPVADAGTDQQLCTPNTSTTMAGSNLIFPATGLWTLVSGQGAITTPGSPNSGITDLAIGENVFLWTVFNGPCNAPTTDLVSIFVFDDQNADADAGEDQDLCTPNNSTTLFGNAPTFPATGLWTLTAGQGTITNPTSPTTTVTDLAVGQNTFTWTVNNGPCANGITSDAISIFLYDLQNPSANAGPDQSICTPATSTNLQGNAPIFPAVGTWTLVSGQGDIVNPNDPGTLVNNLAIGENVFMWMMDNGPCETTGSVDLVSIFLYFDENPEADAGPDQELCTPNVTSTTLSGSSITFPAVGTWALVSGTGTIANPNDPNTVVFDLEIGESVFQWTVDNGPCASGITTDQVTIDIFDENNPSANAGADQNLCTSDGTTTNLNGSAVTFPAVGTWTVVSGTGTVTDPNSPSTTITGMGVGVIVVEWTVDNGACPNGITSDQLVITLYNENNPLADAGPDQELCTPTGTTASTNLQGSAIISPAVGTWTLVSGTGVIANANDPASAVTNLGVGEHIFQWSVFNGPCDPSNTTDIVTILVFDENNLDADAGPDQQVCTPETSAIMDGSANIFPAQGTWTVIAGSGDIADPNDPNTQIDNLSIGVNIFQWEVYNGSCANSLTSDQVSITLFDAQAPAAYAGPDQEFCYPDTSTTISGNTPIGAAIGTWTLVSGTGTITDPASPTTDVTNLSIGENIFLWTITSGVCITTEDSVSLFVFDPNNPVASAGLDQELCVPQDSVFMAGSSLIFPAQGTWTTLVGTGVPVNANDPVTLIETLAIGANTFQWSVYNGPCGSSLDDVTIILYDDTTAAANAGPDLESCLPIVEIDMQGETPPLPAEGTWTVIAGTGVFDDIHDPTTHVTGLSQGTNTFVWTLEWDPCPNNGILTDTVHVLVYNPFAPQANAGPDQELCTPEDQVVMAGNTPEIPGVGTWSQILGPNTATISNVNDPTATMSDLIVGSYQFVWEIYNGLCSFGPPISYDTVQVDVFDSQAPPAQAGNDISWCTPTNSAVLFANDPIFPATGTWTIINSTGTLADPNDPNTAVFGLEIGQHDFLWTIDNGACGTSSDTISVFIYDGNSAAASAGGDQELCTPATSTALAGNAVVFPATGTWTIITGTGAFSDPTNPTTDIEGLSIGTNTFQWTIDNGPCGSTADQVTVVVYDSTQPAANAGPDKELCTPTTTTTLNGNTANAPAVGTWVFVQGNGTLSNSNDPNATISGLTVGTVVLQWVIDNGACGTTTDQVTIQVFDGQAPTAAAGPDQEYCSPVTDPVTMLANAPTAPATGSWSLVNGQGTIANAGDPFTTITNLGLGANVFQWTIDNGECGTTSDEITIMVYDSTVPDADAGPGQQWCQDVNHAELAAVPATSTATGFWSLYSGSGEVEDPTEPDSHVHELQLGYNVFIWTVDNGECGTTSDTMTIFIKDCLTINIPDAFSPNLDGVNDLFVITNIESYPDNKFTVFNRWGNKVYEATPYTNQWDGTSQFGAAFKEGLPESTYYYILDLGTDADPYTGFIYLRR
ncbi:MAG: gliding motility-associated C-terminal domain-containing protein [Flavobacteriales bacterium]|nr:gliding motility-associated C-terminal domain-containing protein [Flavobacteriales bacterium]